MPIFGILDKINYLKIINIFPYLGLAIGYLTPNFGHVMLGLKHWDIGLVFKNKVSKIISFVQQLRVFIASFLYLISIVNYYFVLRFVKLLVLSAINKIFFYLSPVCGYVIPDQWILFLIYSFFWTRPFCFIKTIFLSIRLNSWFFFILTAYSKGTEVNSNDWREYQPN